MMGFFVSPQCLIIQTLVCQSISHLFIRSSQNIIAPAPALLPNIRRLLISLYRSRRIPHIAVHAPQIMVSLHLLVRRPVVRIVADEGKDNGIARMRNVAFVLRLDLLKSIIHPDILRFALDEAIQGGQVSHRAIGTDLHQRIRLRQLHGYRPFPPPAGGKKQQGRKTEPPKIFHHSICM